MPRSRALGNVAAGGSSSTPTRETRRRSPSMNGSVSTPIPSGWADTTASCGSGSEPQQARRVLLDHERADLVLDVELLEVREPTVGRDQREVGAEEHLVLQAGVRVLDQNRREVLGRPAAQVDVDVGLVDRYRERLV